MILLLLFFSIKKMQLLSNLKIFVMLLIATLVKLKLLLKLMNNSKVKLGKDMKILKLSFNDNMLFFY